jgi:hypothetical protein
MNWDEQTIKEWDELGFYYEYDYSFKQWRIFSSKFGVQKFCEILKSYANDLRNEPVSEHTHLGPYDYLKIMTWHEPLISKQFIGGSLKDLMILSELITKKLLLTNVGEIMVIYKEYSQLSTSPIVFIIMSDNFRPSSIEFNNRL